MAGRVGRWLLAGLVWTIIIVALGLVVVPRFLDRTYYQGPVSSHYDGQRFFNPDGDDVLAAPPRSGGRARFLFNMLTGRQERVAWPEHVAVTPGYGDTSLVPCPRLSPGRVENWARCNRGAMDPQAMSATWIGHATVLVQTAGFAMLTDPIWSDRAGPMGFGPTRVAQPGIRLADLPRINLILVSHNHYDHLDLATLKALWERDRPMIVTSLGNDALLRSAGIGDATHLKAFDWGGEVNVAQPCAEGTTCPPIHVRVTRNHHWGSRTGSDQARALWSSFTVDTPAGRVFFAGDTGFGDGRWPGEAIADGRPVRLALLPIGAFRFVAGGMDIGSHVGPRESIKVWNRLGRPPTLPIHWGTFRLSNEGYDTPPRMLRLLMACAGAEDARFTAHGIGATWHVPAISATPPVDEERVNRCARAPEVTALP